MVKDILQVHNFTLHNFQLLSQLYRHTVQLCRETTLVPWYMSIAHHFVARKPYFPLFPLFWSSFTLALVLSGHDAHHFLIWPGIPDTQTKTSVSKQDSHVMTKWVHCDENSY